MFVMRQPSRMGNEDWQVAEHQLDTRLRRPGPEQTIELALVRLSFDDKIDPQAVTTVWDLVIVERRRRNMPV